MAAVLASALTGVIGVFGAGWGGYVALGRQVSDLRSEVYTKYCTKEEQDKSLDRIYSSLARIEDKLDKHIVNVSSP